MTQMNTFSESDVLLPYQKRWVADDSKLKIAEKSRRTGLTWAEAADAALTASLKKENGGSDHFYIGSNKEMAREFIDAVAMWAKAFNAAAEEIREEVITDEDKDILTFVVYFASGFKVKALSSNPGNIRGMQGNVTIDEAAFHEQLDEVLKAVTPLTTWGGKVRLISTHDGVDNPFNQLIQESRAGKKDYRIHTITLDDACNDGLYRRICQVRGMVWSPEAEAEWKEGLLRNTAMGAERMAADVRADNIYSASLDGLGVTMWAVTWEQEFRLDEEIDLAALPDFLRLGATLRSGEHTEINDVIHVRGDDGTETD